MLIQGKTTTPNHKVKKIIHKGQEEWVRYENAFEPIVDRHTFHVVQNLMNRDTRKSSAGLALLGGLIECGDCHQSMIRKSPNGTNYYYVCSTSLYENECKPHSISEEKLLSAVKSSILYYISLIVELEHILGYVKSVSLPERKMCEADQQLKILETECNRLMQIKKNLYNSFCEGLLDEEEFKSYKKKYDATLLEKEEAIKKQKREISDMLSTIEKQQEWMQHFLMYKDTEEIDRTMVVMLVKRIRIHSGKSISIEFWFEDEFEKMNALLQTANKIKPDKALTAFLGREGGFKSA